MERKAPSSKVTKFAQFIEREDSDVDIDAPMMFVASTESRDRYGDVVRQNWELGPFKRNPVALFGHNHSEIVGSFPRAFTKGKQLMAELVLAEEGTGPIVDYVRALVRQKLLRAVSVSFLPLEWDFLEDDDGDVVGYDFKKNELLEISLVSVPANGEALSIARSMNLPEAVRDRCLLPATGDVKKAHRKLRAELLRVSR